MSYRNAFVFVFLDTLTQLLLLRRMGRDVQFRAIIDDPERFLDVLERFAGVHTDTEPALTSNAQLAETYGWSDNATSEATAAGATI